MGAYLDKPVTTKRSEHGTTVVGEREVAFASTTMQGWRVGMEDAHVIVPDFDESTVLLGVFDGHGGKEVAEYCSRHMPEMLQSNAAYKSGDLPMALKGLFMEADRRLLEKDVVRELKRYVEGAKDRDSDMEGTISGEEEAAKLLEEADMPLGTLLAQYMAEREREKREEEEGEVVTGSDPVRSMLQSLVSEAGIEIEFEDSSDSEDSEYEATEEEGEGEGEQEEKSASTSDKGGVNESSNEENSSCLHDNAETSLTGSGPPAPPLSNPSPGIIRQVNGIASEDSSPCAKDNGPRAKDNGPCAKDNGPCGEASTEESHSSKNHILLDLLTSAVTSSHNHKESVGVRESRKRKREEEEVAVPSEKGKKFCRGLLDEEGYHSGTTAVVCLLRKNSLTVANAGDSRCVISCGGKAVDMSEDHKPTDEAELSRIRKAGGHVGADGRVNGGLNLSRAIGDHFYKENSSLPLEEQMITALPDIRSRTLQKDDQFIVLACDGIWNTKSSQEVVDFVRSRLREGVREREAESLEVLLERVCEELCDDCLAADTDNDGTGCDNMTAAIVHLSPHTLSLPLSLTPPTNLSTQS